MPARLDKRYDQEALLPHDLIDRIRPEVPGLCEEIIEEICHSLPEYAPMINGPYEVPVRRAVEGNVTYFVGQLARPEPAVGDHVALCRDLGRLQALQQGELTLLEQAIRIGVRVAWRRCIPMLDRYDIPDNIQPHLTDRLFGYIDELIDHARAGYLATVRSLGERSPERKDLVRHLLDPEPDVVTVRKLAEQCDWTVPGELTVVAVPSTSATPIPVTDDVLVSVDHDTALYVVPGDIGAVRRSTLAMRSPQAWVAAGPTVPLHDAGLSARWARRTLRLAEGGVLGDAASLVSADDHLFQLWLTAEPWLAARLLEQQLLPLTESPPRARRQLIATLRSWVASRENVTRTSASLRLHPQTVRYRLRRLRNVFGPALDNEDWLLATQAAFQAVDTERKLDQGRSG